MVRSELNRTRGKRVEKRGKTGVLAREPFQFFARALLPERMEQAV